MAGLAHRNDIDQRRLAGVLQPDQRELHLLLEEEAANTSTAPGDATWVQRAPERSGERIAGAPSEPVEHRLQP